MSTRKRTLVGLLMLVSGVALANDAWQPRSWKLGDGLVGTALAGWELRHFPDTEAAVIMVLKKGKALVAVTDYPDSVEVRAFDGSDEDFVTLRDKDHDRHYEEIEGLKAGALLKLDNALYQLEKTDSGWVLNKKL